MTLFELLISQAAKGTVKPHQLLQSIRAGDMFQAGKRGSRFVKLRPGQFRVELFEDDMNKPADTIDATSPVEAKLSVIDWLIDGFDEGDEGEEQAAPARKTRR